jgi:hypothetical protein
VLRRRLIVTDGVEITGARLRAKFHLFVPRIEDHRDEEAILAGLPHGHPVKIAFTGGGSVVLEPAGQPVLVVPVRGIRLRSCPTVSVLVSDDEGPGYGVAIRLPDDLVRLQNAWEAVQNGQSYDLSRFLEQYEVDLGRAAGRGLRRLLSARVDGIQAQVVTDPRIGPDQVGVGSRTAREIQKLLRRREPKVGPKLSQLTDLTGLTVLLQRFPVASHEGARWVTVVELPDRPNTAIYVNAADWNHRHGGDEDGDLGYIAVPHSSKFVSTTSVPAWPKLVLKNHEPVLDELIAAWTEKTEDEKVETVLNFFTKDCTGPLTYAMHCLVRAAAFGYARLKPTPELRREMLARVMRGVFQANGPLTEAVMDGRKTEGALPRFLKVVDALQDAVAGRPFSAEPFLPFLPEEEQLLLTAAIRASNSSLRSCRSTAYGRLVAAGGRLPDTAGRLIDDLLAAGISPRQMLDRLCDDALGIRFLELPLEEGGWEAGQACRLEEADTEEIEADIVRRNRVLLVPAGERSITAVLSSIRRAGHPLFQVLKIERREAGDLLVTARLRELWARREQRTWKVQLLLPEPGARRCGSDGHEQVMLSGSEPRFFRPRFLWTGQNVELQRFDGFLAEVVRDAVEGFSRRKGSFTDGEVTDLLNTLIRRGLNTLSAADPQQDLIRRAEYQVVVPSSGDLRVDWAEREKALTVLTNAGFDVVTTSKNRPGTLVTRSWKRGIPRYLFAANPLVPCLDLKRRVEMREIRLALPLSRPRPMRVKSQGSGLPGLLAQTVTELNVMVGDLIGLNLFEHEGEEFGHDTLCVTGSAVEKLTIARWEMAAGTVEEREEIIERLMEFGIGIDAIRCEEHVEALGDGMTVRRWTVTTECHITDCGKVKAAVGPFKGVMNLIPHRLFAVNPDGSRTEIDLVLPGTTVRKKKALDALLYMLAAKAGIREIDPDFNSRQLLEEIRDRLGERGLEANGRQTILVLHADGTEEVLGEAMTGVLPFYRPVQTGFSQLKVKTGEQGIKVQTHVMLMAGGVEYDIPNGVKDEFAHLVECRRQVKGICCEQGAPHPLEDELISA